MLTRFSACEYYLTGLKLNGISLKLNSIKQFLSSEEFCNVKIMSNLNK